MIKEPHHNSKFRPYGYIGLVLSAVSVMLFFSSPFRDLEIESNTLLMMFIGGLILQALSMIIYKLELINAYQKLK